MSGVASQDHYKVLGVAKDATHEEIKTKFRTLSLKTHPDTAHDGSASMEQFKAISAAHNILGNPKERAKYDRQLKEQKFWKRRDFHGRTGPFQGGVRPPPRTSTGFTSAMGTLLHPTNMVLGVAGIAVLYGLASFVDAGGRQKRLYAEGSDLVEAWKNPNTGRWEQAAPWDPTYQRIKPTLELVPRHQVARRHVR